MIKKKKLVTPGDCWMQLTKHDRVPKGLPVSISLYVTFISHLNGNKRNKEEELFWV